LQIDTGGNLVLDNNNNASVSYRIIPGASGGWNKLIVGTSGDTCTFGASYSCPTNILGINNASVNPLLISTNSTTDNMTYQVYGAAIKNCGSASVGCLEYETAQVSNSYASAGLIDIEGSTFDTTGTIQDPVGLSSVTRLTLNNNRFMNDLLGVFALTPSADYGLNGSKGCLVQGNVFSGQFGSLQGHTEAWRGCAFLGNTWGDGLAFSGATNPLATYAWNLMLVGANGHPYDVNLSASTILNTYWIGNTSSSWHMLDDTSTTAAQTLDGGIFENVNSANVEGHLWGPGAYGPHTNTVRNSLSLPSPSGTTAGVFINYVVAQNLNPVVQEHNGLFGAAVTAWGGIIGHPGGGYPTNTVYQYYRSNNHWASSTGSANYGLGSYPASGSDFSAFPNNNFNSAGIYKNNYYHATTEATFGPGVDTACSPSAAEGTHYQICTTVAPGTGDTAVDPRFIDITRNAFQWASRVKGQAATKAGLLSVMMQCQDAWYCYEQLWSWVRQGAQPTNLALKGAAYDGKVVGASGTFGSGYSGSCGVTLTAQDSGDLGAGATATCSFIGGVPVITIMNGGNYYRVATPALVGITCGGCTPTVSASLTAVVAPSDVGPVQMALLPGAM
jgi:hypothetical protein